jgi:tellurite methyltransferase
MMMMKDERTNWNRRYSQGSHASLEPDPLLVSGYEEFIQPLFPQAGRTLDVAGGVGRHAIWLAERNWQVDLLDISEVGMQKARENSGPLAERISFTVRDLKEFKAGAEKYDLVLVFFYLQRELFPELLKSLREGGLLIYKTYTHLQAKFGGGPSHPMHLLEESELLRAFSGLHVLYYRETVQDRGVAELIARK